MALQTSPPISLQDIINEHNEGISIVPDRLLQFDHMFSGGTPVNVLDFLGADQPTGIDTKFATNIDASNHEADFSADVLNTGGGAARTDTQCWVAIEYDTVSTFSSSSLTSWKVFTNGGSAVTWTNVDVSNQGTGTIYYRAVAYNALNTSSSYSVGNTRSFTFCTAPSNVTATEQIGGRIQVTWDHPGSPANGFEVQYRVNGGGWTLLSDNVGVEQDTHNGCNTDYTSTDTVEYRVKAQCSGGDSSWVLSNGVQPTSC